MLLFSCSVVCDCLWPHELQHARLPCLLPSPRAYSDSCPLVMPSNHLFLCHPLLLLPSIFPSIRVFTNEPTLHIRWPKYWHFSFSISPSNEYSVLISFRIEWFDLLASPKDSQKSSPTPQFERISSSVLSLFLWSNSYICKWLLGKPLWLYGPLSGKWCLGFLICCLGLS